MYVCMYVCMYNQGLDGHVVSVCVIMKWGYRIFNINTYLHHEYPLQTGHIMRIMSSLNSHRMRITFPVCKGYNSFCLTGLYDIMCNYWKIQNAIYR